MKTLGLVVARGGSKGIPGKNIRLLNGKSLLHYTAAAALASRRLDRVILSTDDSEIAEVGKREGLDVPFIRPAELARDDTPTLPVVQHAVRWVEENGSRYDAVCLLQPTSPLRRAEDINACIDILESSGADAAVSVALVPTEYNPHWVYFQDREGCLTLSTGMKTPIPRRQDLPAAYHRNGCVYVTRRDVVMEQNSLYGERIAGYVMDRSRSVNLDSPEDWEAAERILRAGAENAPQASVSTLQTRS